MARASRLRLQPGEHRVAVIRRHWWVVVRPLLWLIPFLVALPGYAILDFFLPAAGLAAYADAFYLVDLALSGLIFLKWLLCDLIAWRTNRYLITTERLVEQHGIITVRRREANLRLLHTGDVTVTGFGARAFDYGNLSAGVEGRDAVLMLLQIPQPRAVQELLGSLADDARQDQRLHHRGGNHVQAALTRIFDGQAGSSDVPTVELERITRLTLAAQRRLAALPEETVLYATRSHVSRLLGRLVLPLLAGTAVATAIVIWPLHPAPLAMLAIALATIMWALLMWRSWRAHLLVLTSDRIVELRRPLARGMQREIAYLRAVRDVVLHISAIGGRLLDKGTLVVEQRDLPPAYLAAVPDPDRLKRLIFEGIEAVSERDRLHEQEQLAGTLTDWFEEYHKMMSGREQAP